MTNIPSGFSQADISANDDAVALGGYDLVSYYAAYEATRGRVEHSVEVNGVTYYFSSEANKLTFNASPEQYLPEFGGYCAFAMAMQGAKVPADPETFKIRDGRLYLFYNDYYEGRPFNTIIPWNNNEPEMIGKAQENWSNQ